MSSGSLRICFYFDYISSNAYLTWKALPDMTAKYGAEVVPVPVLFAGLLDAHGQLGPAEVPVKALWMWKNNLRKAAILGVPLNLPAYHPFNPLLGLRASSLALGVDRRRALIDALFDAVWARGEHISEASVVENAATVAGLDGARIVADACADQAKALLRSQTDAAIEAGVFGVPSMQVGEEIFWGYDDLPYLERFLAGADPLDREGVDRAPPAPRASSVRKQFRG